MQEVLISVTGSTIAEVRFDDVRRLALAVVAQILIDAQQDPEVAASEAEAVERGAADHWLEIAFSDPEDARSRLAGLLRDPDRLASITVSAATLAADRAPLALVTPGGQVTPGGLVTPTGLVTPSILTFYLWLCRGDPNSLAAAVGVPPKRVKAALSEAGIQPSEWGEDAAQPPGQWAQSDLIREVIDSDGDLARVGRRLGSPKLVIVAGLRKYGWLAPCERWPHVRATALEEMRKWRKNNE